VNGNTKLQFANSGTTFTNATQNFTYTASNSGVGPKTLFTAPSDTGQTAGLESPFIQFDLAHARQHASNTNIALQRDILVNAGIHSFATAGGTITLAGALGIEGPDSGGSNATITNSAGLLVSGTTTTNVTNSFGIYANASTGATNNYAAAFMGGNVGIGTSSPSQLLTVAGNGLFSGAVTASGLTVNGQGLFEQDGLGSTITNGVSLSNSASASGGVGESSPQLYFNGAWWDTTNSASRQFEVRMGVISASMSATASNPIFAIQRQNAGGGWSNVISINQYGNVTTGGLTANSLSASAGSITGNRPNLTTVSTEGLSLSGSNASAAVPVRISPRVHLSSSVWDTGASAAKDADFIQEVLPTSGNPGTAIMRFGYMYDGGAPSYSLVLTSNGSLGIGTTTPTAQLTTTGTVRFAGLGAGSLQTDAQGNVTVSSDERLKDVNGSFDRGLADLEKLDPILYHWNAVSGLDRTTQYAGFSAQNVQSAIPEAVDTDPRGYLSLQDRPILAASVNAIKELAGRTDTLSLSTTTLATRLTTVESALNQASSSAALPHALTATQITADSIAIAHGVSAGTLTAQSVNADGTVSAARYVVPATAMTFTTGSTTMSADLPSEVLASDGNADLYKVATYGVASTQSLAKRTDLLTVRIDDIESRLSALETSSSTLSTATSGALALATSTVKDALASLGFIIKQGFLALDTLVTHQLVFKTGDDGTSSTGSVTIPAGEKSFTVDNPLVLPTSKIFLTFTSSVDGSWYITDKVEGHFTVKLAQAQGAEVSFDYFLVQTESAANPQIAGVDGAQPPADDSNDPTPPVPTHTDGGPIVTLNGDAAIALAQGAQWTDPGATAIDPVDGDISGSIAIEGGVDTDTAGIYTVTYRATDSAGKYGEASRVVTVSAPNFGDDTDTGGASGGDTGGTDTGAGSGTAAGTGSTGGSTGTSTGDTGASTGAGTSTGSTGSTDTGPSSTGSDTGAGSSSGASTGSAGGASGAGDSSSGSSAGDSGSSTGGSSDAGSSGGASAPAGA